MTPESLADFYEYRARLGALAQHAKHDAAATSAAGRAASKANLDARLLADIDPHHELTDAERTKRLGYARRAFYLRLARRGVLARQAKARAKAKASGRAENGTAT